MATPFTRRVGTTQGRIRPSAAPAVLGDYAFCLGSDVPGDFQWFKIGDYVSVEQTADVTGIKLVRFRAQVRGAASAGPFPRINPIDGVESTGVIRWDFSWLIDGVIVGSRTITAGRSLDMRDGAIDVSQLLGNHTFAFRLKVVPP